MNAEPITTNTTMDPMVVLHQLRESMQQIAETQRAQAVALQSLMSQPLAPAPTLVTPSVTEVSTTTTFQPVAAVHAKGEDWAPARRQISDPELYDGEPATDYRAWRLSLIQVAMVDRACFASAQAIISWAFGRTKGRAKSLLQAYVEDTMASPSTPEAWGQFLAFCDQQFGDEQAQSRKRTAFRKLRQKDSPFSAFYADWVRLLREAGHEKMPDQMKIEWLNEAINTTLWRDTRAVAVMAKTFDEHVRAIGLVADQLEARFSKPYGGVNYHHQQQQKSGSWKNHSWQQKTGQTSSGGSVHDPNEMDWEPTRVSEGRRAKWVSEEEIQRRREAGLCFRCGGKHRVSSCTALPAKRPVKVNVGSATSRIAEVVECPEDGLEQEGKA